MLDFIINIVLIRLAKQRVNLFFKIQFSRIYDINGYIYTTIKEIYN